MADRRGLLTQPNVGITNATSELGYPCTICGSGLFYSDRDRSTLSTSAEYHSLSCCTCCPGVCGWAISGVDYHHMSFGPTFAPGNGSGGAINAGYAAGAPNPNHHHPQQCNNNGVTMQPYGMPPAVQQPPAHMVPLQPQPKKHGNVPCRYDSRPAGCRNGSKCEYRHASDAVNHNQQQPQHQHNKPAAPGSNMPRVSPCTMQHHVRRNGYSYIHLGTGLCGCRPDELAVLHQASGAGDAGGHVINGGPSPLPRIVGTVVRHKYCCPPLHERVSLEAFDAQGHSKFSEYQPGCCDCNGKCCPDSCSRCDAGCCGCPQYVDVKIADIYGPSASQRRLQGTTKEDAVTTLWWRRTFCCPVFHPTWLGVDVPVGRSLQGIHTGDDLALLMGMVHYRVPALPKIY